MPKPEKKDMSFSSSDGKNRVCSYIYTRDDITPFCILQISHGMCEYIERYSHIAKYLVENGVLVCGNDHIGHGATAQSENEYGYFSEHNGRRFALMDLKTMNLKIREMYPGLPVVMLGHSMGSFFAREFAAKWPDLLDGLIISGTGGPNKKIDIGIKIARRMGILFGDRYRSRLLYLMTFGNYMKRIKKPKTPYDWVSRDNKVVDQYKNDPMCNYRFTVNGFHELFRILKEVSSLEWAQKVRKDMPIMMFSGSEDPVGDYGEGVEQVRRWLVEAGIMDLDYKLYPGGRHEMINEINYNEVYQDVLNFLNSHWQEKPDS